MEENIKENKMGTKNVGPLLMGMAVPMMISMLVQAFYNVVDSVFVAKISEDALNAVSLAFPLQNLMIAFAAGTSIGMNALLSQYLGARKHDKVTKTASVSVVLFGLTYLLFLIIGLFFSEMFFKSQTNVLSIVKDGTDYTRVCLCFSFGIFGQFLFERMLLSTGKTHLSMITQIIGAVTNIIMDPILIFGLLGAPKLGVKGAAIATVMGQILAAIAAFLMNHYKNPEIKIRKKYIRFNKEVAEEIYKIGFPSIVMQSISSVMTYGMNKILIGFTTTATAVFGAYFKLQSFVFMPVFGLNNGMVPIISYNYGAKNEERVKKTIKYAMITAVLIMFAGFLSYELMPDVLLELFSPSQAMLEIGVPALRIIGFHYLLAGICIIAGSVCQAIGNPVHSLIVSVCRQLVVLLPSAYILSKTGVLSNVWYSFLIAETVSLTLSLIFLKKTMKRVEEDMKA